MDPRIPTEEVQEGPFYAHKYLGECKGTGKCDEQVWLAGKTQEPGPPSCPPRLQALSPPSGIYVYEPHRSISSWVSFLVRLVAQRENMGDFSGLRRGRGNVCQ